MRPSLVRSVGVVVVGLAFGACDNGPAGPPALGSVVIESGDAQEGIVSEPLANPVEAQVLRDDGSEATYYTVWVELVDGGFVDLGGARASGVGALLVAPTYGHVSALWTLPDTPGDYRLRFFAVRSPGDTLDAFATATALPAPHLR